MILQFIYIPIPQAFIECLLCTEQPRLSLGREGQEGTGSKFTKETRGREEGEEQGAEDKGEKQQAVRCGEQKLLGRPLGEAGAGLFGNPQRPEEQA